MEILESKAPFASEDQKDGKSTDPTDINIVGEVALLSSTGPAGFSEDGEVEDYSDAGSTEVYVVRPGDTASSIAKMFDITADTVWSVNGMKPGSKLIPGDVLLILPFSGVEYTVIKGDTLQGVANKYKVKVEDILSANVDIGKSLTIGDSLIIPGASMIKDTKIASSGGSVKVSVGSSTSNSLGFVYPLPKGPRVKKTQGLHDRYAVDIGAPAGTPIYAVASGTVTFAKMGWNGAYGNAVFLKHSNGIETRYAHMSKIAVSSGEKVSQGQVIGYVGSTGRSTGNHLHIEVRGARNPF